MKITWRKVYNYLDDFSSGGWRKLFFWSSVGTMSVALPLVYVYLPYHQHYAPAEYLTQLNATLVIITGLATLRAVEKDRSAKRAMQIMGATSGDQPS